MPGVPPLITKFWCVINGLLHDALFVIFLWPITHDEKKILIFDGGGVEPHPQRATAPCAG
jgi:hypothetical protein